MTTILILILLFSSDDNPPGTIKVKGHFIDRTEIQNIHWLEYAHLRGRERDSSEPKNLLPDSSNSWFPLSDNRFKPIVLITYEQAMDYCAWRSRAVSAKIGRKVTYRLPTPTEWKEIAEEIMKSDLKQIEKELEAAKKMIKKDSTQYNLTGIEKPKSRVHNMFDNVSEMTLENGIAMGSNNYDLAELNTNLTRLVKYNSPNAYLGFRCVAEIE